MGMIMFVGLYMYARKNLGRIDLIAIPQIRFHLLDEQKLGATSCLGNWTAGWSKRKRRVDGSYRLLV